ncbi:hypothetical protein Zm00014a_018929 [Zea mays]|uniref:Uncharacterized protein n=1 Tax=Zea mays TaxID=4577 RepID=A0A317YEG3_MAIZE|nr:hypothetical protein Zm00014a_018929 [Zea mays]
MERKEERGGRRRDWTPSRGTTARGAGRAHHDAADRRQRRQPCAGRSRVWASSDLLGGRRAEEDEAGRYMESRASTSGVLDMEAKEGRSAQGREKMAAGGNELRERRRGRI